MCDYKFKMKRILLRLVSFLIVIYSFFLNNPYFIWDTYKSGQLAFLFGVRTTSVVGIASVILGGVYAYLYRAKIREKDFILIVLTCVMALSTIVISGGISHVVSGEWLIYCVIILFLLLPLKAKYNMYNIYILIYTITIIPSIFYYIITKLGVSVPYEYLESYEPIKTMHYAYYKLYPMASQLTTDFDNVFHSFRLSGIYDEAGRVGTLAGLFLISENFQIRSNWRNAVILVSGVLSFSLAFWALIFLFYLKKLAENRNIYKIIMIALIPIIYLLFINIDFSSLGVESLDRIQARLEIVDGWFVGDNRMNDDYNAIFSTLFTEGIEVILFGKGLGAMGVLQGGSVDGFSYKSLIFDYGYVGFALQFIWLFVAIYYKNEYITKSYQYELLLVAYIANIYQRPSMMSMAFLLILFGGIIKENYRWMQTK